MAAIDPLGDLAPRLSLIREQDPEILQLLHLMQGLSTGPERASHLFTSTAVRAYTFIIIFMGGVLSLWQYENQK